MADVEDGDEAGAPHSHPGSAGSKAGAPDKMFSLKKWNAVAMWSWDVECDTCAICRVQVMDACLRCQAENKQEDCVGDTLVVCCCVIDGQERIGYIFGTGEDKVNNLSSCAYFLDRTGKCVYIFTKLYHFIQEVVWGECNHSFHNCCMSLWVKQNNRCPLCQQDWVVQRIGK